MAGGAVRRRRVARMLAGFGLLAGVAWAGAAHTVPEYVLFRDRMKLDILHFDSALDLRPIDLATVDGLSLRSYYHAPRPGMPLIVYFPDRLGDIIYKPRHFATFVEEGYGLLLAGYRGYGGNPGIPSEVMLYRDADSLMARVTADALAPDGVIVYGYSMGTGVASYVADRTDPRALVLEAPFTTFGDAVRQQFAQVPDWLIRTKFDTRSRLGGVDAPILILAGGQDSVTPARFAERLAGQNAGRTSLVVLPDANHVNMIRKGGGVALKGFLTALKGNEAGETALALGEQARPAEPAAY